MNHRALLLATLSLYVLLAVGIGVREALPTKKPPYAERSYTMPGKTTTACGFLMPYDTRDDRAIVRFWRYDCGIFGPGGARSGPMGPLLAPPRARSRV